MLAFSLHRLPTRRRPCLIQWCLATHMPLKYHSLHRYSTDIIYASFRLKPPAKDPARQNRQKLRLKKNITRRNGLQVSQGNRRLHFARAVHSRYPLPADRRCGLSSTCCLCPSHGHRQHAQKFGNDRARGSGDISSQTHRQTYSSQYFATAPAGEVIIVMLIDIENDLYTSTNICLRGASARLTLIRKTQNKDRSRK